MILARTDREYELHWINGEWRDIAGHLWSIDKSGILHSKEHGQTASWKIPVEGWEETGT